MGQMICDMSYLRHKFHGLGMWCPLFRNAIAVSVVSSILTSGHRPSVLSPLPAEETKDIQDVKFPSQELKYLKAILIKRQILPAAISEHEEQHAENYAGHADMDSNHHSC